ncbi:sensor histidine kinase, partial [Kitasatospora purpeofusca]|uniref:sensor histidine kinase n=1 Tax=Kitasatospora purpeofusca TaxID=67352 RepID=UPI0035DF1FDF
RRNPPLPPLPPPPPVCWQDVALALAAVVPELFYFGTVLAPWASWDQRVWMFLLALGEAAALVVRRRWPVAVFGAVWVISAGSDLLSWADALDYVPCFGLMIALYTVAAQCRRPVAYTALLLTLVPLGLAIAETIGNYQGPRFVSVLVANLAFYVPVTLVVWGFARWSRAAEEAAERHRQEVADARLRVTQERVRIARELHDIVANAVAVIVMRAETARVTALEDPARGEAFGHIEDLGRSTMAELRHMLRLLRSSEAAVECGYSHGLGDLDRLLADVRKAGVRISVETRGAPLRIDDSVSQTAYRLVQEAATNITKHAGPGTKAVVRITWDRALLIEVVDDGAGRPPDDRQALSTGHGLLGLRERVALYGGLLSAAPYGPGYRVAAALPVSMAAGAAPGSKAGAGTGSGAGTAATRPAEGVSGRRRRGG